MLGWALAWAVVQIGCGWAGRSGGSTPTSSTQPVLLEMVGDYAVVRLHIQGFDDLSPSDRAFAFYLYRAALAGRDIVYDQWGRENLEIRDLMEEILTHSGTVPSSIREPLHHYLKLFWIHNGNHDLRTRRKLIPALSFDQLRSAASEALRRGAAIRMALGEDLDRKLSRLRPAIFDPEVDPLLTCASPPPGGDILGCGSVNYYDGVTLADLDRFNETHPRNSRLVKRGGSVREEIYRAGRGGIPPGRYASDLQTIIGFLSKARSFADPKQAGRLQLLEDYFAIGDQEALDRSLAVSARSNPIVDTVNGFIGRDRDPRRTKGTWTALVYLANRQATALRALLAAEADRFHDPTSCTGREPSRAADRPAQRTASLLVAFGEDGPMTPVAIPGPGERTGDSPPSPHGVTFLNVIEARDRILRPLWRREFALPEDRKKLEAHAAEIGSIRTALHDVLGHGSESEGAAGGYNEALREARADLIMLHHLFDPKLVELGAISSSKAAEAASLDYVVDDLTMLRTEPGDEIEAPRNRSTHLIVSYLREESGAIETLVQDGRTYMRLTDPAAMRQGVATLLETVCGIESAGDGAAARDLFARFGTRIDPRLRDEVVARFENSGLPSDLAFVMPEVVPVRNAEGAVVDATIADAPDLTTQMLKFSGKLPLETQPVASVPPPPAAHAGFVAAPWEGLYILDALGATPEVTVW